MTYAKVPGIVNTPLNLNGSACLIFSNSHLEVTRALIQRGADVNGKNKYGKTPIMYACQGGHLDVVKLLHASGADIFIVDREKVADPVEPPRPRAMLTEYSTALCAAYTKPNI